MIQFTGQIDKRQAKAAELQAFFDTLEDYVNTTKIDSERLIKQEVVYRHLLQPPTFHLAAHTETIMTTVIAGATGWYYVNNLILKYTPLVDSLPNQEPGSFPVVEVGFKGGFVGTTTGGAPLRVCIGISTDGGANWIPLDDAWLNKDTSRSIEGTSGASPPFYGSPLIPDPYMPGEPSRYPLNYPFERCVELTAFFGGDSNFDAVPTDITHYTVMVDGQLNNVCNGFGFLTLDARS